MLTIGSIFFRLSVLLALYSNEPVLHLEVRPHFLLSGLAILSYILLFVSLITLLAIIWQRWRRMQRKLVEEETLLRKQKRQLVYFSDLSHEIRNRLPLILGSLEKAMQDKEIDRTRLQRIYQNALLLKKLSDRIMEVGRRESGHFCPEGKEQDVRCFLKKPFSGRLLRWRINNLLRSRDLPKDKHSQDVVYTLEPDSTGHYLSADEEFLNNLVRLLEENLGSPELNVEFLASQLAMSRPTLYRHMERLLHEAPANFIRKYRLKKAALFLQDGKLHISEVAYLTGFRNPKYFSKCFQKEFGCNPSDYVQSFAEAEG